jgi:hypothetical protein
MQLDFTPAGAMNSMTAAGSGSDGTLRKGRKCNGKSTQG